VVAAAAVGAGTLGSRADQFERLVARTFAALLAALRFDDLVHNGAHPSQATRPIVEGIVTAVASLGAIALRASVRFGG
jgi:hypothetical protein